MKKAMIIISDDRKFDYVEGKTRELNIGKRRAERIFQEWRRNGETIHRDFGMGGHVQWVWIED